MLEKGAVLSEGRYRNSSAHMANVAFFDNHFDGLRLMERWCVGRGAVCWPPDAPPSQDHWR